MVAPLHILSGVILLFLGRQLFWVFVAVLGFTLGMDFGTQLIPNADALTVWIVALTAGALGAIVAYFFYHAAIAVSGFLAGGRVGIELLTRLTPSAPPPGWLAFIVGGVLGAVLLLLIFDWALICLSSLLGASIVVQHATDQPGIAAILFIALTAVGIVAQAVLMRRSALVD